MDDGTLRSTRLKKWTVGLGRRERDRIRALETVALNEPVVPRDYTDEIAAERGVTLMQERGGVYRLFRNSVWTLTDACRISWE